MTAPSNYSRIRNIRASNGLPKALEGERCGRPSRASTCSAFARGPSLTPEVLAGGRPADRGRLLSASAPTRSISTPRASCGIPVFNAPFSNTRSVAELVIGEIVMLLRRIFPRSVAAHAGGWDKSADRQPRGARQDARHRRLRQYRLAAFEPGGSDGHAVIFFDQTDKLRHGNTEPVETPGTICWRRATSSACTCRRRRPPQA